MKQFNRLFAEIAYRHDFMRVFDDFLTLTLCAFGMGRYEDEYLQTLKTYNKKEVQIFPQLLGALVEYTTRKSELGGWADGLGDFFQEHNGKFGRDARGQFFTPTHLCDLMAQINSPCNGNINDPAAGSGRCLIAADRLDPNNRFNNFYTAQDVDRRCVKMCAINMVLYGMKGVVLHMDSICLNIHGGYRIYLPETGLGAMQLSADECRQYVFTKREKTTPIKEAAPLETPINTGIPQQTELFKILSA